MALPPGPHSLEDMRNFTTPQLYELMFTCQSPGSYQFCVEELQRRFLEETGFETKKLTESSARLEAVTTELDETVKTVGNQIGRLTGSSNRIEGLTKWLIGLTVALFCLTALQVVKETFFTKETINFSKPPASVEQQAQPQKTK